MERDHTKISNTLKGTKPWNAGKTLGKGYYSKYEVTTPLGVFDTFSSAGKAHELHPTTIRNRCDKGYPGFQWRKIS